MCSLMISIPLFLLTTLAVIEGMKQAYYNEACVKIEDWIPHTTSTANSVIQVTKITAEVWARGQFGCPIRQYYQNT